MRRRDVTDQPGETTEGRASINTPAGGPVAGIPSPHDGLVIGCLIALVIFDIAFVCAVILGK